MNIQTYMQTEITSDASPIAIDHSLSNELLFLNPIYTFDYFKEVISNSFNELQSKNASNKQKCKCQVKLEHLEKDILIKIEELQLKFQKSSKIHTKKTYLSFVLDFITISFTELNLLFVEPIHTYNHLQPFIKKSVRYKDKSIQDDFMNEAFIEIHSVQEKFRSEPEKYSALNYLKYTCKCISNRFVDLGFQDYSGVIRYPRRSKGKIQESKSHSYESPCFVEYSLAEDNHVLFDEHFEDAVHTNMCALKIAEELNAYSIFFDEEALGLVMERVINNSSYHDIASDLGSSIQSITYQSQKTMKLIRNLLNDIGYSKNDFNQ